ncbi:hypothetical protein RFI_40091, partial [Reticulomyxa filosa]
DNNKDSNQITLLSFGSIYSGKYKHTSLMKYVSVWSNISDKSNELNNYNQWIPFTDNHNHPIIIETYKCEFEGARAVIGGSNNHLLFIAYPQKNIGVFNLNTLQFIEDIYLPINYISYPCFVSNSKNGQGQEMMKANEEKNRQNYQMLLFCFNTGLSIEYYEDNNTFQFQKLP